MFYIFDSNNILRSWSDSYPDLIDLQARNEFYIESEKLTEIENAFFAGCEIYSDFTYRAIQPTEFHVLKGKDWIDPRTEEEKLAYKRSQYPKLTRYQFMRGLLEEGFKSSEIEAQILLIEDEYARELIMLGFKEATNFDRTDQSIVVMRDILKKTDKEVDEFWEYALVL